MDAKLTLVVLLCGLAYASAYYVYSDRLDDDYYPRSYRLASYGYAPAARYYVNRPAVGGYPTYRSYNRYNLIPRTMNYGAGSVYYEDVFKKKK